MRVSSKYLVSSWAQLPMNGNDCHIIIIIIIVVIIIIKKQDNDHGGTVCK